MTESTLKARLLAEADFAHSLIAETVGERRQYLADREALLREAADALPGDGPKGGVWQWLSSIDQTIIAMKGRPLTEKQRNAVIGVLLTIDPASPFYVAAAPQPETST